MSPLRRPIGSGVGVVIPRSYLHPLGDVVAGGPLATQERSPWLAFANWFQANETIARAAQRAKDHRSRTASRDATAWPAQPRNGSTWSKRSRGCLRSRAA